MATSPLATRRLIRVVPAVAGRHLLRLSVLLGQVAMVAEVVATGDQSATVR